MSHEVDDNNVWVHLDARRSRIQLGKPHPDYPQKFFIQGAWLAVGEIHPMLRCRKCGTETFYAARYRNIHTMRCRKHPYYSETDSHDNNVIIMPEAASAKAGAFNVGGSD